MVLGADHGIAKNYGIKILWFMMNEYVDKIEAELDGITDSWQNTRTIKKKQQNKQIWILE